jgi:hypothetical protein
VSDGNSVPVSLFLASDVCCDKAFIQLAINDVAPTPEEMATIYSTRTLSHHTCQKALLSANQFACVP